MSIKTQSITIHKIWRTVKNKIKEKYIFGLSCLFIFLFEITISIIKKISYSYMDWLETGVNHRNLKDEAQEVNIFTQNN